ncbi:MAG: hypothetical protein IIB15_06620, partial [Chloroflexi bacterium]|nr:hypothetical protein [Chloroflexota bacterium]
MAVEAGLWDRLTESSKDAFRWAFAVSEASHYEDIVQEQLTSFSEGASVPELQAGLVTSEALIVGIMQA